MAQDDDDLELDELVFGGGIVVFGLLLIGVIALFRLLEIDIASWAFTEWSTVGIVAIIGISIFIAILLGSDEDGEQGGVFTGFGFPLTIMVLILGLVAVQTNLFGLSNDPVMIDLDGDGQPDISSNDLPEDYVDYGSPQAYGFGNYGPPNEGLLSDGAGCAAGATAGAATGLALGLSTSPLTAGIGIFGGPLLGGAIGCAAGFFGSAADFDGDPTTGW